MLNLVQYFEIEAWNFEQDRLDRVRFEELVTGEALLSFLRGRAAI